MATVKTNSTTNPLQNAIDAVLILSIAEAANKVNAIERADGVQVKVDLPTGIAANDTIRLLVTNPLGDVVEITRALTEAEKKAGTTTITIPPNSCVWEGAYSVSAYFKDAAGNTSRTASAAFEVDRTAPSRPDAPAAYVDDVGAVQSPSSVAGLTDDARPGILVGKNLQDVPSLYVDGKRVAATYDASAGTLTPDLPVSDGKHVFAYTLTDAAGNESFRSNGLTITIDATATSNATVGLAVSILGDANNDGWVNAGELGTASTLTSKATFNASAVAGDKIVFKATNNGVALPDQTVTLTAKDIANKYVMVNFAKPAEGTTQAVTAAYMDAAGNVAKDAALKDSATLDTVATAPVIEKVEAVWWNDEFGGMKYHKDEKVEALPVPNGGTMQSGWPQIYGKAEPGSSVDIYKSNSSGGFDKLDTETAKEDGTFHYNYYLFNGEMLRIDGETHTFKVAYKDAAGNVSAFSNSWVLTIDSTAPAVPAITVTDDVGEFKGGIANNGVTDDATPTISGAGTAGNKVIIYDNDKLNSVATITVGADGKWSYTPAALADGSKHSFSVREMDAARNFSDYSTAVAFTVDTTATSNATVGLGLSLAGDANNDGWVNAGELNSASMLTSKATFNASAVAGDKIVFKATNNGVALPDQILTLTAKDIANKYVMVNFAKPAEGTTQAVTAAYMDAAGNVAKDAALKDSATLDTVATAPVIEKVEAVWWNDEFGGMKYHTGEKVEVLPVPNGGTMQSGWPQIYGSAEAGSSVDVYRSENGAPFTKIGTVPATADGKFHYNYVAYNNGEMVVDGRTYGFKVVYTDAAGNTTGFSNTWTFTADSTAPDVPVITVTDDVGEFKGGIANNGVTDDARPTISGAGTAGNKVIIYDNDKLNSVATITVGADGKWSYTPAALADGSKHSFSVREMDAARNFSDYSTPIAFTVDTTAPLAPSAAPTTYKDDVGSYTTATSKEGTTDDNKPGINIGKGLTDTPNLYVDGAKVTSVYDATNGTLTPASALGDGSHTFAYSLSDKAGNESGKSGSLTFAVDASGPTATVSLSDSYLVPGQTALVKMVFSEKVKGLDVSDISAPNGTISDLASADGGKTWTATFTPNANVNGVDAKITLGTGYTDVLGNAGSAASSATYKVQTSYGVSLGAGVSVAETSTSYETRYKTFVSDTQAFGTERWFNNFGNGHDYILEYKLSDGSTGKIDISDDEGSVDSSQKLLVDSTNKVTVTDVRLWNYTCAGIWKSVSGTSSTMNLEDDAGVLAWGLFADWNDAQVHVETQSYLKAYTTTVYSTDYRLNFSNSATFKQETPNACYKISLSGGSNYQLLDASGNVLQTGAGTYQATMAQIDAGLKVHVNAGGTAPSGVSAAFVSTASPLVLDLDGDGVQTVSVEQGVRFDLTGKGAQPVGWMERQDGLLAIDLNHNGLIDSGAELFGNATALSDGQKAADGWAALAALDSNADGHIDARDAHFADLRLWVDADGDAVTDAGELRTLAEAGVTSLNVAYARSASVQNGNLLDGSGSFTKADGSVGAMTDVWFQTAPAEVPGPVKAAGAAPQGTLNLSDVLASSAQDAVDGVDPLWMNQHNAHASVHAMLDATLLAAQIHCA